MDVNRICTTFSHLWYLESMEAKIIRSSKREFDCLILDKKQEVKAVCLREILKKEHPVVGDKVLLREMESDDRFEIYEVCERQNEIFRRIVRSRKKKVIASNLDAILIVTSVSKPEYKPFLIDRYITRTVQWNIPAIVIFNKMDEFDNQFDLEFEKKKFESLGVNYFEISNEVNSRYFSQVEDLRSLLRGKTTICLGQSGVGKSRLISSLSGGEIELLSARLAKGVEKGAHTTTWAELIDLGEFFMVDSPGVRTLSIADISPDELIECFPDLEPLFGQCKFKDCRHEKKSKGCYFNELDEENLEDLITLHRLHAYKKMREEAETIPDWQR